LAREFFAASGGLVLADTPGGRRRLVRAADQCVIDAGGLVGRHGGDGVVAFFLAEIAGTESAAAPGPFDLPAASDQFCSFVTIRTER
jgi:hypothetical protein